MTKFRPPDKDGSAPEQRIVDPLTGKNYTGEYDAEKRGELESGLREVFSEIALKAFDGKADILEMVMSKALEYYNHYFQAVKGGTNLHPEDIKDAVTEEVERQNSFYHALANKAAAFNKAGIQFEVLSPDRCYKDSYWDTGLVSGCNIATGSAYLCAFPLVPAKTTCYMALVQEPVAAQVVFISEGCVLLAPHDQDFSDDFFKAGETFFVRREEVKKDFPEAIVAYLGNNFLCVDTDDEFSRRRLEELKAKYRVSAIVKGGAGFTGCIFTGKEDKLPALFREGSLD